MIYPMLGFVLDIIWGIIVTIYAVGHFIIIASNVIDYDALPDKVIVAKFLIATTVAAILWWLVWVLSFYV
jgi:hypothetical protein